MTERQKIDIGLKNNDEEKRTSQQNKAIHLWYRQLAEALNREGHDVNKIIKAMKEGVSLSFSELLVKEVLWRPIQEALYGKKSTTELLKQEEIDKIVEVLVRFLGENMGMIIPIFPSKENKNR